MRNLQFYMNLHYDEEIRSYSDNTYGAEIKEIPGLCAYSETQKGALEELEIVKETAFELMLEQNKDIPLPSMTFEIPILEFEKLPFKDELEKYAIY